MTNYDVIRDIAERTNGDIYVGVVGGVRTGKSTFVSKVVEKLILPNIPDELSKKIATDEMPQSAEGKAIMTTQPKFIPSKAVNVSIGDNTTFNMRLIDSVGYIVNGAIGYEIDGKQRMVKTPWDDNEMTFEMASKVGTDKVINEHSNFCILVTTDGSFTDIERNEYEKAEELAVNTLKKSGKPFCILLNVKNDNRDEVFALKGKISSKYGVPVIVKDCSRLEINDIEEIFQQILFDFDIKRVDIDLPNWVRALPVDNSLVNELVTTCKSKCENMFKMKDFSIFNEKFEEESRLQSTDIDQIYLGKGVINCKAEIKKGVFYSILSEECGYDIIDEYHLLSYLKCATDCKNQYDKIKCAVESAKSQGYGVVVPPPCDIEIGNVEVTNEKGNYSVKLKTKTNSLQIMSVPVEAEVKPYVGKKEQCEEMVSYLEKSAKESGDILQADLFGKPLGEVVYEGVKNKFTNLSNDISNKLVKAVTRIVNEGDGGVLCILI